MPGWTNYRGLQVPSDTPTGDAGLKLKENFSFLANWGPKSYYAATSNPTTGDDVGDDYYPGSIWLNTSTGDFHICVSNATNAAVWSRLTYNDWGADMPSGFSVTQVSTTFVELAWTNNASFSVVYSIDRSTVGTSGPWTHLDTTPTNATRYVDLDLTPETTYYYRLRAQFGLMYSAGLTTSATTIATTDENAFVYIFDNAYAFDGPLRNRYTATDHNPGGPTLLFQTENIFGVDNSADVLAIADGSEITISDGTNTWPGGALTAIGTGATHETNYYSLHTNSSPDSLPQLDSIFANGSVLTITVTPP